MNKWLGIMILIFVSLPLAISTAFGGSVESTAEIEAASAGKQFVKREAITIEQFFRGKKLETAQEILDYLIEKDKKDTEQHVLFYQTSHNQAGESCLEIQLDENGWLLLVIPSVSNDYLNVPISGVYSLMIYGDVEQTVSSPYSETEAAKPDLFQYSVTDEGIVIEDYSGDSDSVVIPDLIDGHPVVEIGDYALYGKGIKRVSLPKGLKYIGDEALAENPITSIELPSTLLEIGDGAFSFCPIKEVILPDSVTKLGWGAFSDCSELKRIQLSAAMTEIPGACFHEDMALEEVIIPEGITVIGESCFYYCKSLKQLTLPQSLRSIESEAFCESNLQKVVLPSDCEEISIGNGAFMRCEQMKYAVLPSNVIVDENWNEYMFYDCPLLTICTDQPEIAAYAEKYGIPCVWCQDGIQYD